MRGQIFSLVHHDAKAVLEPQRDFDEVERVEPERAVDVFWQNGLGRERRDSRCIESEPLGKNALELLENLLSVRRRPPRAKSSSPSQI